MALVNKSCTERREANSERRKCTAGATWDNAGLHMAQTIELGLDTFGDATVGPDGQQLSQAQSIRNLVLQGELADQVGLAFIGVGEHHRPDFSVSAPEVVLGAIAARTTRIHLGSAVTVLSTD